MADDNHKVKIDLDVSTTGEDTVNSLIRSLDKLASKQKTIDASLRSIGRPSQSSGGSLSKDEAQAETIKTRGRRSKAKAEADSLRTAQRINLFDRESVKLFQTKIASQTKATAEAMKAERQTFANFRTRNAAQARYETAQVRALRDRMTAESRIGRMRSSAENDAISALKTRLSTQNRAYRQRVSEERSVQREQVRSVAAAARAEAQRFREAAASIRENARLEAREARNVERDRSRRVTSRDRNISNLRTGGNDIREAAGRVARGSAAITAATTGTAALAARKGISTRMEVDTQETNLKIFSGQSADQIKAARKGFLDNEAIRNGLSIAGGLETYSEVLKTGMKAPEDNTKTIMQAVSALELDLKNTTKLAGLIDRNLGARSDPSKIKSALNAVAVAAREDPTQSNEIVEGVKRSFGALSTGNITPEQLTAMVSGGQSVGIQPGKAGTFVTTMAKQLSMGSSKFLGKKNREELNFAAKELGFGDARSLAQTYSKDSYNTMMQVHEKLANMEAAKRTQVAEALYGRQWSDEGLQMAQGVGGVRKTYGEISDSKNANFLEEAAKQRAESLQGQWNSTKSIFGRFWDAFGQGFEDILNSINKYFLELNSKFDYDQIKGYVVSFFDGVKEALGVKTWQELLHSIFGGELGNIGPQIKAFAKGLTEGVMAVGRAIRSFASVFGGSDMSAETMGKLTGEFIAMSVALVALSPVIGVLSGLVAIVGGIAASATAISALGTMGGGASAAAGAAAVSGWTLVGTTIAAAFVSYLLRQAIPKVIDGTTGTKAGTAIDEAASAGGVTGLLGTGFNLQLGLMKGFISSLAGEKTPEAVRTWSDPPTKAKEPAKSPLDPRPAIQGQAESIRTPPAEQGTLSRAWDWITSSFIGSAKANEFIPPPKGQNPAATPTLDPRPAIEQKATAVQANPLIQQQNFGSDGELRSLIHKASYTAPEAVISGTVGSEAIAKPADPRLQLVNLTHAVEENTSAIRAGLDRQGIMGGLIHRASITSASDGVRSSLAQSASDLKSPSMGGSLGQGGMTGGSSGSAPLSGSVPGSALNGGSGLSRRGIIGGGGNRAGGGAVDYDANTNTNDGRRSRGATSAEGKANVESWSSFLQKSVSEGGLGMPKGKALATIAMMQGESGGNLDPKAVGDSGNAFGTAQWSKQRGNQRFPLLQKFAASQGKDWRDRGVQQQYLRMEMLGLPGAISHRKAYDAMMGAATDEGTLKAGIAKFENPQKHDLAYQIRLPFLNRLRGQGDAPGGAPGGVAAAVGADPGQYDGLRVKGGQAVAGGAAYAGVTDLARQVQESLPGGVKHFSAFNDRFHLGRNSKHNQGLAFDTSLIDGSKSAEAAEAMRNKMRSAGLTDKDFRVIDEYKNPSPHSTGGHIHSQFNNAEAAKKYSDYVATLKKPVQDMVAMQGELVRSSGWKPQSPVSTVSPIQGNLGGITDKADAIKGSSWKPFDGKPTASIAEGVEASKPNITDKLPGRNADAPGGVPVAGGGNGGNTSSSATTNNVTINGANMSPDDIASAIQRKTSKDMRRQTTGVSPYSLI